MATSTSRYLLTLQSPRNGCRHVPDQDFYRGLTLPEQIEKFLNHHYDEQNRHISAFEAQMLRQVLVRLRGERDS